MDDRLLDALVERSRDEAGGLRLTGEGSMLGEQGPSRCTPRADLYPWTPAESRGCRAADSQSAGSVSDFVAASGRSASCRLRCRTSLRLEAAWRSRARHGRDGRSRIQLPIPKPVNIVPMTMAVDTPPFKNASVRQAFRLIAGQPQLVGVAQDGFGAVGNDLFGKGFRYYDSQLPRRGRGSGATGRPIGASLATDLALGKQRSAIIQTALETPRPRQAQGSWEWAFVQLALSRNTDLLAPLLAPQPVRIFSKTYL
jgi:hypothetical protein